MKTLKCKKITSNEGYTIFEQSDRSVKFYAELPKNAVVDSIKVNGRHISDLGEPIYLAAHRECESEDTMRLVATAYVLGENPSKFFDDAASYAFSEFEILYHEEAVTEV